MNQPESPAAAVECLCCHGSAKVRVVEVGHGLLIVQYRCHDCGHEWTVITNDDESLLGP